MDDMVVKRQNDGEEVIREADWFSIHGRVSRHGGHLLHVSMQQSIWWSIETLFPQTLFDGSGS